MRLLPCLLMVLFAISCLAQVQADSNVVSQVVESVDQAADKVSGSLSENVGTVTNKVTENINGGIDAVTNSVAQSVADGVDTVTNELIESKDKVVDNVTGGEEGRKAEEKEEKEAGKYEGASLLEKVIHSAADASVDTVAREAKHKAGTPIVKPIINGVATQTKKQLHKQITNVMRETEEGKKGEEQEQAAENGIGAKLLSATTLIRRKRSLTSDGDAAENPGIVRRLIGGLKNIVLGRSSSASAPPSVVPAAAFNIQQQRRAAPEQASEVEEAVPSETASDKISVQSLEKQTAANQQQQQPAMGAEQSASSNVLVPNASSESVNVASDYVETPALEAAQQEGAPKKEQQALEKQKVAEQKSSAAATEKKEEKTSENDGDDDEEGEGEKGEEGGEGEEGEQQKAAKNPKA